MRITQCYSVLRFFKPHVFKKYGFKDYTNPSVPTVFWGLYPSSLRKLISHNGMAVIVWRGSDALQVLKNKSAVKFLQENSGRFFHVAISNFIEQDLIKMCLPFKSIPLTSVDMSACQHTPRGDKIYVYTSKPESGLVDYGLHMANEVSRKTGIPLIVAHCDTTNRINLIKRFYPQCFLGLRLLEHDGLSNTVIELGLCGRQVVTNLNTPNALPYRDEKDIVGIVERAYKLRKEDNKQISIDTREYINVGYDWLMTEFWTSNTK